MPCEAAASTPRGRDDVRPGAHSDIKTACARLLATVFNQPSRQAQDAAPGGNLPRNEPAYVRFATVCFGA